MQWGNFVRFCRWTALIHGENFYDLPDCWNCVKNDLDRNKSLWQAMPMASFLILRRRCANLFPISLLKKDNQKVMFAFSKKQVRIHGLRFALGRVCRQLTTAISGKKNVLNKQPAMMPTSTTLCHMLPVLKKPLPYRILPFSLQQKEITTKNNVYGNRSFRKENL